MDSYISNRLFDVAVVGGGISGLGVALACAERGYDTILLERRRLAEETSANSLRIMHGGFRYFQSMDLPRIVDAIRDQSRIMMEAPSLVKLLPCVLPLQGFGLQSRLPCEVATRLYNGLRRCTGAATPKAGILSARFVDKHIGLLSGLAPRGALLWYDARLRDPQKFAHLIRHKIDRASGHVLERVTVRSVQRDQGAFRLTCEDTGGEHEVRTRMVVNATGPWLSQFKEVGEVRHHTVWSRAFNVVLRRKLCERFAVAGKSDSGRLYFVVPRGDVSVIGTGYLPAIPGEEYPSVSIEDIAPFLEDFSRTFPRADFSLNDVGSIEWGRIPVKWVDQAGLKVKMFGQTQCLEAEGWIDVLAAKYTSFHSVGERVADLVARRALYWR